MRSTAYGPRLAHSAPPLASSDIWPTIACARAIPCDRMNSRRSRKPEPIAIGFDKRSKAQAAYGPTISSRSRGRLQTRSMIERGRRRKREFSRTNCVVVDSPSTLPALSEHGWRSRAVQAPGGCSPRTGRRRLPYVAVLTSASTAAPSPGTVAELRSGAGAALAVPGSLRFSPATAIRAPRRGW